MLEEKEKLLKKANEELNTTANERDEARILSESLQSSLLELQKERQKAEYKNKKLLEKVKELMQQSPTLAKQTSLSPLEPKPVKITNLTKFKY